MKLLVGRKYQVHYPSGDFEEVTVIAEIGGGWYKVKYVSEFYINLNQIYKVDER
ncbi:MAG: hypothetical protein QOF61_3421 [Acidobacteriota bacterium]|jgi:hypothetical protein|nr:hypothetical protein [Acidobacteriota bacterium]